MKDVQCYELFGGIALKNDEFSFFHFHLNESSAIKRLHDPNCRHSKHVKVIYRGDHNGNS